MDGDHHIYSDVGITCGTFERDGQPVEVVGLLYPTETTAIDGECEERHMTLAAAKALIIDLQEAVEVCMKHQRGEPTDQD